MAYWHITLLPSGKNKEKWKQNFNEKELLTQMSLIGMGVPKDSPRLDAFKNKMKKSDIVLVRNNSKPIALVEVIDGVKDRRQNDYNQLDWFRYARKVKVLAFADNREDFTSKSQQVLRKSSNEKDRTYQYIDDWYNEISPIDDTYHFSKIEEIYIEKYKMFNQFTLNLCNEEGQALPIIVIAGKNGTGKTSLIEYLSEYSANSDTDNLKILKKSENNNSISENMKKAEPGIIETREEYKNSIKYMPVEVNKIGDIEEYIADYYIDLAEEYDSFKKALKEVQSFISEAFEGLALDFNVSRVDYKEKKVFFKKNNSSIEFMVNDLSTGEKTLLSKVLSLFFEKIKNKIILIDEPELSLHPSWQNKILKIYENFAVNNNCQIIIATHSSHIIGRTKNKYLRILRKTNEDNIEVVDNLMAYGRDIEWVLEEVMGSKSNRAEKVLKQLDLCQQYLNEKKYDEAEECINDLEENIGQHDIKVMNLRNALFFERD